MPCLQFGSVEEIPYAEERINFYLRFPHLFFDFGKILSESSACNKAELCESREYRRRVAFTFMMGVNEINHYPTNVENRVSS